MDYQKQGTDFLRKHNINMAVKFVKFAPHFIGEKESRDIFKVTFSRKGGKRFSITFGQSLIDSTGTGANVPLPYDVLTCITKDDPGSHDDFCSNYGYDIDSINGLKIYKSVVNEWEKGKAFFTEGEFKELQAIQ